jgi:conjugal transfer pilus assembly protein TraI
VIFASEIAEVRVKTIPRWRIATFVAGLLSDTYRAVTTMRVLNEEGAQWNPFSESLSEFLKKHGTNRYYIKWIKDAPDQQSFNSLVVGVVVPPSLLAYLAATGPKIVGEMLEGIAGTGTTPLARTIKTTRDGLIKRDVQANPNFIGRPMIGSHLEANLVDAMRRLVKEGKWRANENGQPLWNGADGLFLVIQSGWKDIYSAMQSGGFTGIPTDFEIIAEVLLKAGVIVPSANGYIHEIKLPAFDKRTLEAVRLTSGTKAFGDAFQGFAQLPDVLSLTPMFAPQKSVVPAPTITQLLPHKPTSAVSQPAKPQGKGKTQQDDDDLPPDVGEFLTTWATGGDGELEEIPVVIGDEVDAPESAGGFNESVWMRVSHRMTPAVGGWLKEVVRGLVDGTIPAATMGDAIGIPASMMDEAKVNRGEALAAMTRDGMIWMPPGQTKKLVAVDGESYLFFNKRFIDEVTK